MTGLRAIADGDFSLPFSFQSGVQVTGVCSNGTLGADGVGWTLRNIVGGAYPLRLGAENRYEAFQ